MDLSPTAEYERLYEEARQFAAQRINSAIAARAARPYFGEDEWRLCGELGLLGSCVPEQYGGRGHDALTVARVCRSATSADVTI
jgi:glutaryl-CoA dehydrogenase (non-decarboxylating)